MATLNNQLTSAIIADLQSLVVDLYAKADDYLRSSKSYTCRGNSEIRAGMIKGAAVMRVDASKVQAVIDKHKEQADVLAEVQHSEPSYRPLATEAEPEDQDTGHVDLSSVPEDH